MVTTKQITEDEFVAKKQFMPQGDLEGDFSQVTEYLTSVLNAKNTNPEQRAVCLRQVIETLHTKWKMSDGVTIKYLLTFLDPERKYANDREWLHHLLRQAGFRTTTTKNYFRQIICNKSSFIQPIYSKNAKGIFVATEIPDAKKVTITSINTVFTGEVLRKVITEKEYNDREWRNYNLSLEFYNDRKERLENEKNQQVITPRQQKAITRYYKEQNPSIKVNCPECKHEIIMPLGNNVEGDRNQGLAHSIYEAVGTDANKEIYFCSNCRSKFETGLVSDVWNLPLVARNVLHLLEKASGKKTLLAIDNLELCNECRLSSKWVESGTSAQVIMNVAQKLIDKMEKQLQLEAIGKGDKILVRITA